MSIIDSHRVDGHVPEDAGGRVPDGRRHDACPASSLATAHLGPGQVEAVAEEPRQPEAGLHVASNYGREGVQGGVDMRNCHYYVVYLCAPLR